MINCYITKFLNSRLIVYFSILLSVLILNYKHPEQELYYVYYCIFFFGKYSEQLAFSYTIVFVICHCVVHTLLIFVTRAFT